MPACFLEFSPRTSVLMQVYQRFERQWRLTPLGSFYRPHHAYASEILIFLIKYGACRHPHFGGLTATPPALDCREDQVEKSQSRTLTSPVKTPFL